MKEIFGECQHDLRQIGTCHSVQLGNSKSAVASFSPNLPEVAAVGLWHGASYALELLQAAEESSEIAL